MLKVYDLVLIRNSNEHNTPLVIHSVLGENKKQGVYKIEDMDGNILNPVFLDEDLIEFKLDISSNELKRRVNFNYKHISENLENYNHEIISLKKITEEIIEDALNETIKNKNGLHNGFDSHFTFNKLNSISLEYKSTFIKDLEDYINLNINNSHYSNIDNLLTLSLQSYISHIFDINHNLILKKILLLNLNNFIESLNNYDIYCFCNHREKQMRTSKYFLLYLEPEDIINSIDVFLDNYEFNSFKDLSFYRLKNNYYEYLKSKFNISDKKGAV